MQLAYAYPGVAHAPTGRVSRHGNGRAWPSSLGVAAALSVGAHVLALMLWQPAAPSFSDTQSGPRTSTPGGRIVVDLTRPVMPAPEASSTPSTPPVPEDTPAQEPAAPPAPPAPETAPLAMVDAAPVAQTESAPRPTVSAAPRPGVKPVPPRPARPAPAAKASADFPSSASDHSPDAAAPSAPPSLLPVARTEANRAAVPVVRAPRFLSRPAPPAYPTRAVQLGLEGTAIVRALVGGAGAPEDVKIHRSSGFEMLDDAALAAVKQWKFAAAVGAPRAWVELPVRFHLR